MSSLNTQLTINLTQSDSKNTMSISYRPSEFQAFNFSANAKSLDSILALGTNTNPLHSLLSRLNTLLISQVNIHDNLALRGVAKIKPELLTKKLTVSKLLNSVPSQLLEQVVSLLTNTFIKNDYFYDFSLGMLDFVSDKIKTDLNGDFTKIKRRINDEKDSWSVNVLIESVNGYSFQSKTSSFTFKDNYQFAIDDIGGIDNVTKEISSMFSSSIRPYTDIYMEKIVTDAFRAINSHNQSHYRIYNQIEHLAWNLFQEDGAKRLVYLDSDLEHDSEYYADIYTQFDVLTRMFNEKFSESLMPYPLTSTFSTTISRQVTVSDDVQPQLRKIDYKNFATYHNTHYYKFLELTKKGIVTPPFATVSDIHNLIHRTKRYFSVLKIGDTSFTKMLEEKSSLTTFENVVATLETAINTLIDAVCLRYQYNTDIDL
jgi:hypothetical protein